MLQTLHISNYALIDRVDITFHPGLNVITGETGAGKSIILGALGLILGERADSKVVADKERKSVIEAVFTTPEDLKADDFDVQAEGLLTLRREIAPGGRSRAFINDTPVTLNRLREVAIRLVDIHSQHQNLLLSQPEFQLSVIDSLASNGERLAAYRTRYRALLVAMKRLKQMRSDVARSRTDEEYLRFQLEAVDRLNLRPGELEELEAERERLAAVARHSEHLSAAIAALDSDRGAVGLISAATEQCEVLDDLLPEDNNLVQRLEALSAELKSITDTLTNIGADLSYPSGSDMSLENLDERIAEIRTLERRHNVEGTEALIALADGWREQLALLDGADERIAELERAARRALAAARESAAELTEARCQQAAALANELRERAIPLGMKNLQCEIHVDKADLGPTGADSVEFLFAFNKARPLLPLGSTASGGEISRLMLVVKAIIAESMSLPTLLFDEVDTGVSGDVAARMGALMLAIAGHAQVVAITHLPQVAAKGEAHFKVYKEDDDHTTHTHIRALAPDERVDELAAMLGGTSPTPESRANARALLSDLNHPNQP